ncbi:hypothetical protein H1R20_g16308, partial [Candolleomyces eurysporus]
MDMLIPNNLDLFTSMDAYGMVLSYLKKKGYAQCKQIYPRGTHLPEYGSNLRDISLIFELINKKAYKINVIVSKGQPLLPILHFHSTPVMNYIAYHGLVCLYDIMVYQLGIANYMESIPDCVKACFAKYQERGFEIWEHFKEEHICKIDSCCPQTIRSPELRKNKAKLAL